MTGALSGILAMAAPLLFATLGALATEYAGVLAVFMEGAITFAGFVCVAVTGATKNPALGFAAAAVTTVALLFIVSRFTERTKANPFLTGLSVNLFAAGITSWLSAAIYGTRGVIALPDAGTTIAALRNLAFPASLVACLAFAAFMALTVQGNNLRVTGSAAEALAGRGIRADRYRTASWCIAAFFAACAGSILSLSLGAWVPNLSAGRGWTALAAVYLGFRNPFACVGAVLVFSAAEYLTTIMQGTGQVPATLILGLPYALSLAVFLLIPQKKR
jgi:simple sugar transport system permease protein